MALKAGRVGVNPSQVDMAGNVIGGSSDTYTKLEIDQMMGSKVGIGQLEANNKDFYFAYDTTTQKYGYKLDNEGDFHPFEEGGSGGIGWVKPPELISTGLTFNNAELISGGYQVDSNYCYIDMCLKSTSDYGTKSISGLASVAKAGSYLCEKYSGSSSAIADDYTATIQFTTTQVQSETTFLSNNNTFVHIWGMCELPE